MVKELICGHRDEEAMPVCMASYMIANYGHANHAFRVNVCS